MKSEVDIQGSAENPADNLQLISFNICEEEFGIDILIVKEIIRIINVTRVPNTQHYVEGVINLRGKVIPIIDLRRRLNMPKIAKNIESRIIVVDLNSKLIGFIVDNVNEVISINKKITEKPPANTTNVQSDFITAIAKLEHRLLILLDLEKIAINENKEEEKNI